MAKKIKRPKTASRRLRDSTRGAEFKKNRRKWLNEYRQQRGCSRCKERHLACLEFHHTDESTKNFAIMAGGLCCAMEKLQEELRK